MSPNSTPDKPKQERTCNCVRQDATQWHHEAFCSYHKDAPTPQPAEGELEAILRGSTAGAFCKYEPACGKEEDLQELIAAIEAAQAKLYDQRFEEELTPEEAFKLGQFTATDAMRNGSYYRCGHETSKMLEERASILLGISIDDPKFWTAYSDKCKEVQLAKQRWYEGKK